MEMNIRTFLIGLLIFSTVMVLMGNFTNDLLNESTPGKKLKGFDKSQNVTSKVENIKASVKNFQITNPLSWGNVVGLVVGIGDTLLTIPGTVNAITSNAIETLNLPGELSLLIWGSVMIFFVMELFSAINKYKT